MRIAPDAITDAASLVRAATARLATAGVPSPRHDAEALAAHALGIGPIELGAWVATARAMPAEAVAGYRELVNRRAAREPLQHLTGVAGFRYLDVLVGPGVFVPRPETELVAEAAIAAARRSARATGSGPVVVDLCAGTAAIALAVATEVPGAVVHAVEREADALAWARRNVAAAGAPATVHLHHGDAAGALAELDGRVDVVVSNPPYVPDDERERVAPEVRHDPDAALWGGPDGLDTVRVVVATAARLLRAGGALVVEHADRHGAAAPALLAADGRWDDIRDHADLAGRPRYLTATRHP